MTTVSTQSNVYQRQIQQEEANSPSDFTLSSSNEGNNSNSPSDCIVSSSNGVSDINIPSGFIFSLSNRGNQDLSHKDNLNSTFEVKENTVEPVEKEIAVEIVEEAITL